MPGTACLSAHPPTPTAQAGALLGVPVCAYWQWTRVQRSPHVEPSRTGLIPWSSEGCGVCLGSFWVFASHDHLGMGSLRAWGGCESVLSGVVRRVKQMGAGRGKRWAGPQTTFTSLTILLWAGPSWGPGVTGERPLGIRPKVRVALTSASGGGGGVGTSSLPEVQRDDARVVLTKSHCCWWRRSSHRSGRPGSAHCPAGVWTPDTEEDSPRLSPSSTAETGCQGLEPGSPRVSARVELAAPFRRPQAGPGALEFGPRCV